MISLPNPKPLTEYGTRSHYKKVFEDYICELSDIGTDPDAMFLGMLDAIAEMVEYHDSSLARYAVLSSKIEQLLSENYDNAAQSVGLTHS